MINSVKSSFKEAAKKANELIMIATQKQTDFESKIEAYKAGENARIAAEKAEEVIQKKLKL